VVKRITKDKLIGKSVHSKSSPFNSFIINMRIILYLGKGGVVKTTVSAATATAIARRGGRVLIMSTDVAHSLADALSVELSSTPVEVEKNLFAMEVNVLANQRELD